MRPKRNKYATVSALAFALVAFAHGWRAIDGWPVRIGSFDLPVGASAAVAVLCGALAVWGWRSR